MSIISNFLRLQSPGAGGRRFRLDLLDRGHRAAWGVWSDQSALELSQLLAARQHRPDGRGLHVLRRAIEDPRRRSKTNVIIRTQQSNNIDIPLSLFEKSALVPPKESK